MNYRGYLDLIPKKQRVAKCPSCAGEGFVDGEKCGVCHRGQVTEAWAQAYESTWREDRCFCCGRANEVVLLEWGDGQEYVCAHCAWEAEASTKTPASA